VTERNEAINSKQSILVGTDFNKIVETCNNIIKKNLQEQGPYTNPFGDGKASIKIEKQILQNIKNLEI
jgi:UDP-N-acetylglucosamine 2-epimerase